MNETTVTVVGTVCSEVRYGQAADDTPIARFQIRNTPRRFDKRTGTWGDGDPSYYSAVCWRHLADHVASSMGVGDPVVATGRLRISRWRRGEEQMVTAELDVQAIGHDLRWGTTVYRRANAPIRIPGPPRGRADNASGTTTVANGTDQVAVKPMPDAGAVDREPVPAFAAAAPTESESTESESTEATVLSLPTSTTAVDEEVEIPAAA
ncbi:MAG: hypothetical protein AUG49_15165 [Catenulispora sp. 13_1_20CM_3_70_7]|nr:single-stranded DNA-binding protein [Catenulisporales bacterium]OLE23760.1 MAG: hypothetical protein AUG49_15165 [Catenulispora sp. 13_1_20CM_3_70_7]